MVGCRCSLILYIVNAVCSVSLQPTYNICFKADYCMFYFFTYLVCSCANLSFLHTFYYVSTCIDIKNIHRLHLLNHYIHYFLAQTHTTIKTLYVPTALKQTNTYLISNLLHFHSNNKNTFKRCRCQSIVLPSIEKVKTL